MSEKKVPNDQDRRMFKRILDSFFVTYRIQSPFEVRIRLGDKECDAIAQDISEAGLGLLTNHGIPPSALVNLKFIIFNHASLIDENRSRRFELEGEVRYKTDSENNSYRLGVRFRSLSDADRNFITDYVRAQTLNPDSN